MSATDDEQANSANVAAPPSLRRRTVADGVDDRLVDRLRQARETLFVERKSAEPDEGFGPTIASFANTLGGWLLIGVKDKGAVVGFKPPGRGELQDWLRHKLRDEIDPLPAFAAVQVPYEGVEVGLVHVTESMDTPHLVTATGAIYVREPGGKRALDNFRDLRELAARGEAARARAESRFNTALLEQGLTPPTAFPLDLGPGRDSTPAEWTVKASLLSVPSTFADRALSVSAVATCEEEAANLHARPATDERPIQRTTSPFPRGMATEATQWGMPDHTTFVIDAAGVVAGRIARRRQGGTLGLHDFAAGDLSRLVRGVTAALESLGAGGRALCVLEARGVAEMQAQLASGQVGYFPLDDAWVSGEITLPAAPDDVRDLCGRWVRELARAAGIKEWEPDSPADQ